MKTKIKYKAITLRGKPTTKIITYDHPEFKDIKHTNRLKVHWE